MPYDTMAGAAERAHELGYSVKACRHCGNWTWTERDDAPVCPQRACERKAAAEARK